MSPLSRCFQQSASGRHSPPPGPAVRPPPQGGRRFFGETSFSPATRFQPFLDLIQPIGAPEGFAVDHYIGGAEDAAGDGGVSFGASTVLDLLAFDPGQQG